MTILEVAAVLLPPIGFTVAAFIAAHVIVESGIRKYGAKADKED